MQRCHSPNRFICRGPGGLVSEFLVSPQIGGTGITAGPTAGPLRGKCSTPGSQDSTDRAKGHFGSEKYEHEKVIRMKFSIMEKLS